MKIYHNPRCSKSRQTLTLIQERGKEIEIIEYLKNPLTFEDLELILVKLSISPIELVRNKEEIWKENYK
ncbi:MAG TPA: arsenate reductase, partial [Flavobacteriales bacterium]|nr:arsenate reductase [Flavobacteriales bacterium]